jgi:hypothetical protein
MPQGLGDPVLGQCNYCQQLGRVYVQEDEYRPLFLVCIKCITDILQGVDIEKRREEIRRRHDLGG